MRNRHGNRIHHTDQVHIGCVDEIARLRLSQRHGKDAGIGDHDIEVAEIRKARLDGCAQLIAFAHVGLDRQDAAATVLDQLGRLVQILRGRQRIRVRLDVFANVDRDDVGTFLRHPDGVRGPGRGPLR